jgi:hypothetical protein
LAFISWCYNQIHHVLQCKAFISLSLTHNVGQVGQVDVGASIEFLSQYPAEKEFLFPPLSCLEVMGEPRVEPLPKGGGHVVVIPLRVNANLRAATVDELIARRKRLHAAATRNLREELSRGSAECSEKLDQLLALRRAGGVELLRGHKDMVEILQPTDCSEVSHHGGVADFTGSRWVSLWAPALTLAGGKAYFEVEVLEAKGTLAAGVAGTCFRSGSAKLGELGDDSASWGVYSFGKVRHIDHARDLKGGKWLVRGALIGIAVDLSAGTMLVSIKLPDCAANRSTGDGCQSFDDTWTQVFPSGLMPGLAVGGGLFPVIAGGWGARVVYNFGHRAMRLAPPDGTYLPFKVMAEMARSTANLVPCLAEEALAKVGASRDELLQNFDMVWRRHEELPPEDFNDDSVYRDSLVEILDAKTCAERKREAVKGLLEAGADPDQLLAVRDAPSADFRIGGVLEAECPKYSWSLLLSGWLHFVQTADVPLACSPSLIALVWRAVLDAAMIGPDDKATKGQLREVRVGGTSGQTVKVSELVPTLRLRATGLHRQLFEHAVLGLVVAAAVPTAGDTFIALTDADFHGLEFSPERTLDLARAVVTGRLHGQLRRVNRLQISRPADGQNLRETVLRETARDESGADSGKGKVVPVDEVQGQLGSRLDLLDWAFVAAEAAAGGWRTLDISDNGIECTGVFGLAAGLEVSFLAAPRIVGIQILSRSSPLDFTMTYLNLSTP